jgi:hypothetical protein
MSHHHPGPPRALSSFSAAMSEGRSFRSDASTGLACSACVGRGWLELADGREVCSVCYGAGEVSGHRHNAIA